jgi:acyl CoA:acetate/3-ketoacid CoA transferase beta subunit
MTAPPPDKNPGPGVSPAMDVGLVSKDRHQTHHHGRPTAPPPAGPSAAAPSGAAPGGSSTPGAAAAGGGGPNLAEVCVVACAEAWRGDGAILASPMGVIPTLGARLAQLTFAPHLLLTDGEAHLLAPGAPSRGARPETDSAGRIVEGWLPYRSVFTMVAAGLRHVMMGAAQIDRFGNQNISCIGDWARPRAQLLGVRGAPGNTINHPVSYWVPRHLRRVFVERADMVSGIGYDRAAALGPRAARFHELRVVVTNLAVLDFQTPGRSMRLRSVHPGVTAGDVTAATGFPLAVPDDVPATRLPTAQELALIRGQLDPDGLRDRELA